MLKRHPAAPDTYSAIPNDEREETCETRQVATAILRRDFARFDFALPLPYPHDERSAASGKHYLAGCLPSTRLSQVKTLVFMKEQALRVGKCIYDYLPYSGGKNGFEQALIEELETDAKVLAHCRLYWAHQAFFHIGSEEKGSTLTCHPDFLVRTSGAVYMVEKGSPSSLTRPDVRRRLRSAASWCEKINVLPPWGRSHLSWHYVLLLEEAFQAWREKGEPVSRLLAFARLRPMPENTDEANANPR